MQQALQLAQQAQLLGEVPVGALVVSENGELLASGFNQPITQYDPTAHAEIVALRAASQVIKNYRLPNTTLYVTIEPCTMCLGAMMHARVSRLVFGAKEPRAGAVVSQLNAESLSFFNHQIAVTGGVLEEQCGAIIRDFFRNKRL